MKKISIFRVFINVLLALFFGLLASTAIPANPLLVAAGIFLFGTVGQILVGYLSTSGINTVGPRLTYMALQVEVWITDIEENLFYGNEFLMLAIDDSQYVDKKTVHVPQAGANPRVVKNRVDDETAVTRRTDTDLTYDLANFTTDPILVKDIEQLQISYSKRQSILSQHQAVLNDCIALNTLYSWAVSGSAGGATTLRTTGAIDDTQMNLPDGTGISTGYRLLMSKMDIATTALKLDLMKVPKEGRFILIPSVMFYGLFTDSQLLLIQANVNKDYLTMGVIGELFGLNIIVRGEVLRYTADNTNTLKPLPDDFNIVSGPTDCAAAIAWSRYMVSNAKGSIDVYMNAKQAKSYGDIMSAEVNHGAARRRNDKKGVVCLIQGYSAVA